MMLIVIQACALGVNSFPYGTTVAGSQDPKAAVEKHLISPKALGEEPLTRF